MTLAIQKMTWARQTVLEAPLIQLCFTVSDLDSAVRDFARMTGAGPWYRVAPLPTENDQTTYRGSRSPLGADIALAYSGSMMYELVAPRQGSTSVFSEWVARFGSGLHHFGYAAEAFDRDFDDMTLTGKNPVMTSVTARGARVAMFEGDGPTDALHEIIEITSESRQFYDSLRLAAEDWTDRSMLHTDLAR
jgi:hypothetical protein